MQVHGRVGHALQLGDLAVGGCAHAPRRAETFGRGEEVAAHASRVLALKLHNSGNCCYQNAFVMSWLWAIVHAHQHQVGGRIDDRIGRCCTLINALLIGTCDRLTKVFAWSAIMQQWPRPQQQHDIGEFATHALPKLRTHLMQGSWFARKGIPCCRDVDTGPLHMPILMPIPNGINTIQACVEAWCHQNDAHALGIASPLLLVQLGRFRHRSHRHVRKYRGELKLDGIVHMPIFIDENSLELTYAPYRVIAGAYQLGKYNQCRDIINLFCMRQAPCHVKKGDHRMHQSLTQLMMVATRGDVAMQSLTMFCTTRILFGS